MSKVEGVTSCSVSLLTNSMGVEGDAKEADILAAVEKAGYSASVKGENTAKPAEHAEEEFLKDKETPVLKKAADLIVLFPCAADVSFDGTYDVELAASRDSGRESCGNGNFTALADRMCDDHQSVSFLSVDFKVCCTARPIWIRWWHLEQVLHLATAPMHCLP